MNHKSDAASCPTYLHFCLGECHNEQSEKLYENQSKSSFLSLRPIIFSKTGIFNNSTISGFQSPYYALGASVVFS